MKAVVALFAWLALAGMVSAQGYPNRPVKVVVPWPPGQATDIAARVVTLGLDARSSTPDEMGAFLKREQERYGSIIKAQNIKVEQ